MDDRSRRIQARFEAPLLVAALLVIPLIAIEESAVGEPWDTLATALNWGVWTAFLAEIVVMLRVVPDRRRWLRDHPLELAIVILTPPFLPASLQAARVLRLLRLLRLLRAAPLVRRLLSLEGIRDAAVVSLSIVLVGGAAFVAAEKGQQLSAWDGFWWALTTVTTVGYGDISPQTPAGRAIAAVVMLVGIGFVALITGAAAERIIGSRTTRATDDRLEEIAVRLGEIERRLP